ncbi:unnamed protein product [Schistosoma mattheei]|uniref:Uncharacterized protein n=1 Tax=Schistosoma mattheei TaxID=31246 RepID=A0A3P8GCD6_9TREM|nr:unnamed protein product [Schistosoma mattheei]
MNVELLVKTGRAVRGSSLHEDITDFPAHLFGDSCLRDLGALSGDLVD